jgi:hypothetical protein
MTQRSHGVPLGDTGERHAIDSVRRPSVRLFSDCSRAGGIAAAFPRRLRHVPRAALPKCYTTLPCVWKGDDASAGCGQAVVETGLQIT